MESWMDRRVFPIPGLSVNGDANHTATWPERPRYHNMLVLKLPNAKDSGKVSKRDDFKLAARSLVVLGSDTRKEGKTPVFRRAKYRSMRSCDSDLEWRSWNQRKMYGSPASSSFSATRWEPQDWQERHEWRERQDWQGKAGMARKSTASLSRATLQGSCTFVDVLTVRVQTSASVVHATECEDRTPRTRATDDHFFVLKHT